MMEQLVDRSASLSDQPFSLPRDEHTATGSDKRVDELPTPSESTDSPAFETHIDLLGSSAATHAQAVTSVASVDVPYQDCPGPGPRKPKPVIPLSTNPWLPRYGHISKHLLGQFPPQNFLRALVDSCTAAPSVLAVFFSHQDRLAGKPPDAEILASVPDERSHPAVLARRLLQLALCLQQHDGAPLPKLPKPIPETIHGWVSAVANLVTCNDDLVGCQEGIECLVLQSSYMSDAGHLRKAWTATRRAMYMAQLLGLDRPPSRCPHHTPVRSVDPTLGPTKRPAHGMVWFRIVGADRYLSLLLGLPMGSHDDSFADDESTSGDGAEDKLAKRYIIIAGRIAARNKASAVGSVDEALALTKALDADLEGAAQMMAGLCWDSLDIAQASSWAHLSHSATPHVQATETNTCDMPGVAAMNLQVRHCSLLIITHLPHLLRARSEPEYEHNRMCCMRASRAVLERFLEMRHQASSLGLTTGRFVYAALVAAMTVLLGHLGRRRQSDAAERGGDRVLVGIVRARMAEMGRAGNDRLARESADTIGELLPIVQESCPAADGKAINVHLTIPFLGTLNINPQQPLPDTAEASRPGNIPSGHHIATETHSTTEIFQTDYDDMAFAFSLNPALPPSQAPPSMGDDMDLMGMGWPDLIADVDDWILQGGYGQYQ